MEDRTNLPIGFMDSGLGGISVLKEAVRILPGEDFVYFGDSANAPYGTKEREEIKACTFAVVDRMIRDGVKAMVVACNTATAAAITPLRKAYPEIPIIGIEPAIKPAVRASKGGRILMMATPMTIAQKKYQNLLEEYKEQAEIISIPCLGLMEFVEAGDIDEAELAAYFDVHLLPHLSETTESIVLGCTHYPFLKPYLKKYLAAKGLSDTALIDGSVGTSMELKRQLERRGWLKETDGQGNVVFENSAGGSEMIEKSISLFESPIE